MKKILLLLIPVIFFSCEKTEYSPDPKQDTFLLKGVTYSVGEGDGMETFVRPLHSLTYHNNTSLTQKVIVDPLTDVWETSHFSSNDTDAFAFVGGDTAKVAVPMQLNEGIVMLGETKWLYRSDVMQLAPTMNFRDTIDVPANTRLTLFMNVYFNEFELSYTATFEGSPSGAAKEVKGKWKGAMVANVETQMEFQ